MPLQAEYIADANRLDLTFYGNVDITVTEGICNLCKRLPPDLRYCVIDLTQAKCVFHSGIGLLRMLHRDLLEVNARVVILSGCPKVREVIPLIRGASQQSALAVLNGVDQLTT